MKAAVFAEFGGPEVVQIEEMEMPEPGPGEVRIAVKAAAMNHLDLWVRRGLPIKITMPHIGGSDIAGVVDALGPEVAGVEPGTRVVVDPSLDYDWYDGVESGPDLAGKEFRIIGEHTQGGFAEYCVVPAANLVQIPAKLSLSHRAFTTRSVFTLEVSISSFVLLATLAGILMSDTITFWLALIS